MAKKLTEDQLNWILSVDSTEAQQGIRALTKENRELERANKERREAMVRLEMQGKKETDAYKNLSAVIKENNDKLKSNRSIISGLEDKIGTAGLTMTQLKKKAQDLQRQLDNTSQATHPEDWTRLNKNLTEVRTRMDELKTAGRKTEESLGDTIFSKGKMAAFWGNMYTKAVEWGTEAIAKFKEFTAEGVKMAGMAQGVERAFNRISTPGMMDELRRSTKGMVNDLQLMQSAVKAKNFKIPLDELGTLLRFAQQRAQETGESVEYLTDSIVTGIGRQSPLILDNLGISAKRLSEEVAKTGDFAKAVGVIVREELSKSGESIDTAADKAQQRAVLLQNIQMSIGQRIIGVVDACGSAWTSFLDVINRWVSIPTVEKLRDEQRETNILARSILAAEGRTEARNLLIQEMQRQYPSFLANMDTEKLTNEQLAERLRDVNKEYENKIRVQVLNDKVLSPLQEKQKNLIEEQTKGIMQLSKLAEEYPDKLSKGFIEAIRSGEVLKMSSKDIQKELSGLQLKVKGIAGLSSAVTTAVTGNINAGLWVGRMAAKATGTATSDIEHTIKRLGEIPSELETINNKMQTTTSQIVNFGKTTSENPSGSDNDPQEEQLGLLQQYEEDRKKLLDARLAATEEATIKEKNIEIKALDEKIAKLQEYGVEKGKSENKKDKPYEKELEEVNRFVAEKQLALKEDYLLGLKSRDEYNQELEMLELDALNRRMDIYQLDKDKQIEILDKIQAYKIKILEQNQKFEESQAKYLDKAEKKEKKKKEKSLNEELKRVVSKNNEQQQKEFNDEQQHRQRMMDLALGFSTDIGSIVGGAISGNSDIVKSSLISIINMGLDALKIQCQMAVAGATMQSLAQADSILTFGSAGFARAALLAGLIEAAFTAVKATIGGLVNKIGSGDSSSPTATSSLDTGSRVVTGKQSGGYLDVVREQDGKEYNAVVDPDKRGFVDRPTVIVGDGPTGKSREWVASNDALQNPTVAPFINVLNEAQEKGEIRTVDMNQLMRKRLAGFESGGFMSTTPLSTPTEQPTLSPSNSIIGAEEIRKLNDILQKLEGKDFRAYVVYSDLERKKATLDRTRRLGGK